MYRCDLCNRVAAPGTPARRVIKKTRRTDYTPRRKAQRVRIKNKTKLFDDPGGEGIEIAREAIACPTCASEHATT